MFTGVSQSTKAVPAAVPTETAAGASVARLKLNGTEVGTAGQTMGRLNIALVPSAGPGSARAKITAVMSC